MTAASLPRFQQAAAQSAARARAFAAVARARIANTWLCLGGSALMALVATSILGHPTPLWWFAGLVGFILIDRLAHQGLLARCAARRPPPIGGHAVWTAVLSIYSGALGALLWPSSYVQGETLAVIYFCGLLANAAVTLRASSVLSLAGALPIVLFLLGLPLADYLASGAGNPHDLAPIAGVLLLLGVGIGLWRSLAASDAAQARSEAAALRERQAAAAAAAAKSDIVRRVNDELRTPMAALVGAAEHLRRTAASPQTRAHIATLLQAGEVLKLVLDDLSDLNRIENGDLRVDARPADPREIVSGVVGAFRVAAQDKGIELFLDIDASTPAQVVVDPLRVRQVLFNLLANAVRYTTHGGVRVRLHAQASPHEGCVRLGFVVADSGVGMSRSQLAIIFGGERGVPQVEGPGLGLAISLRLARLMGGRLQARSELGAGSILAFTLDAPVVSAAPQLLSAEPALAARRA